MSATWVIQLSLVLLLWLCVTSAVDDWADCPHFCRCKWVSGKKSAECRKSELSAVPDRLSSEMQSVDLSDNPLNALPAKSFSLVGLVNLHKIFLKDCLIRDLDPEAFSGLEILFELDLSGNRIHTIHPETFRENPKLRLLYMSRNPIETLEDGLFTNLTYLQTVDMAECQISRIGQRTFEQVPNLQYLYLHSNRLSQLPLSSVESLHKLKSLELHNNPWRCDCRLKQFRDWTISRNLYVQPTSCAEPDNLKDKFWDRVDSEEFACRPQVLYPGIGSVVEASSEDVTLSCKVAGDPSPEVLWVYNARVIGNLSRVTYNERKFSIREGADGEGARWVNLTVLRVRPQDRGEFTCVARSPGGVDERNITLVLASGGGFLGPNKSVTESLPLILAIVFLVAIIAVLSVVLFCCCCVCRKRAPGGAERAQKKAANNGLSPNGDLAHHIGAHAEQEKSLLTVVNPVQKPPRRHDVTQVPANGTLELSELKQNLLDDTSSNFGGTGTTEIESRKLDSAEGSLQESQDNINEGEYVRASNNRMYPPDLLAFPNLRGSQASPAGSTSSTIPESAKLHGFVSPINSPIYHMHPHGGFGTLPYSRSQSPFNASVSGTPIVYQRQGYVTIPRRPHGSWSSATTPTLPEDSILGMAKAEPVYDNLGCRTTASGRSIKNGEVPMKHRALPSIPVHTSPSKLNTLPANYSSLQDLDVQRRSTASPALKFSEDYNPGAIKPLPISPNVNDRFSTLQSKPDKRRGSWSRPPSELSGTLSHAGSIENSLSPTRRVSAPAIPSTGTLGRSKVPPKPPPKPKKKTGPLFEDEGEDGTEV